MRWIGQLKRLSSGWPAAIKSSPTGYRDATEGRLYLCLIQQFIVIFFSLLSSADFRLNLQFSAKCLFLACRCALHLKGCSLLPRKEMAQVLIHFCEVLRLSCGEDADVRLVEVRRVRLKLRLGGREDCVAVSLWLSWDLKLWSGSFRLSLMSAGLCDSFHFLSWQIAAKQSQQPYWF